MSLSLATHTAHSNYSIRTPQFETPQITSPPPLAICEKKIPIPQTYIIHTCSTFFSLSLAGPIKPNRIISKARAHARLATGRPQRAGILKTARAAINNNANSRARELRLRNEKRKRLRLAVTSGPRGARGEMKSV